MSGRRAARTRHHHRDPYQVNKTNLITNIADLVQNKSVDGITDIRDESGQDGIRIVLELRRDVQPDIVLNYLYKHAVGDDVWGYQFSAG